MNDRTLRFQLVVLCVAVLCRCSLGQSTVHYGDRWSIQIPEGWVAVPQSELDTLNSLASRGSGGVPKLWDAGYAKDGSVFGGQSVLISEMGPDVTWSNFRSSLGDQTYQDATAVMSVEGWTTKELVESLPLKVIVVENDHRRALLNQVEEPEGRGVREFLQIEPGDHVGAFLLWQAGVGGDGFGSDVYDAVDSFAWAGAPTAGSLLQVFLILGCFGFALVGALALRIWFIVWRIQKRNARQQADMW